MQNTAAKLSENFIQGNLFRQTTNKKDQSTTGLAKQTPLQNDLEDLSRLVANLSESHTAAIYLADTSKRTLKLGNAHTLSRDFNRFSEIPYGAGLIGWTAENELRISVSPFEHDAKTLLCYDKDQNLKSFIAIPIHCTEKNLLGVIACDSKKSYAFSKVTEKLIFDCARQAANLIGLHKKSSITPIKKQDVSSNLSWLDSLRQQKTENKLLSFAASLPKEIVDRDALVIISNSEAGVGQELYYCTDSSDSSSQTLLELICQNKKILCGGQNIGQLANQKLQERSFLSIPFKVLGKNAGSINLLSKTNSSFNAKEITQLEKTASSLGEELERVRLKDAHNFSLGNTSVSSWKHFEIRAKHWIKEAKENNTPLSLIRLSLNNIAMFEKEFGIKATTLIIQKLIRLVEQVKRDPSLTCFLYGNQIALLCNKSDVQSTISRLQKLIQRISPADLEIKANANEAINQLIENNISIKIANLNEETNDLNSLLTQTLDQCKRSPE